MFKLTRFYQTDKVTFGRLKYNNFSCYTLELPWRHNEKNISRIPPGSYNADVEFSDHFKTRIIRLEDRAGRTGILIHPGNYLNHTQGCILVGSYIDLAAPAVLSSRKALKELIAEIGFTKYLSIDIEDRFVNLITARELMRKFERGV